MDIKKIEIDKLIPALYNPRKDLKKDDAEYKKIKRSIEQFGYVDPVIVNSDMTIVGGHQRYKVLKDLGYKGIECVVVDLDKNKEKALNVALNKISGEWDFELLGSLLEELKLEDFDVTLTGFEMDDIEGLLNMDSEEKEVEEDDFNADEALENIEEPISKRGDIWLLGKHRVMCGDSTSESDVSALMDGKKADMVHTDPPYNVNYSNADRPKASKTDLGKIKNDVMDNEKFAEFLKSVSKCIDLATKEECGIYVWYASNSTIPFYSMFEETDININQQIIWKKPMLLGRGNYQWAHEPCIYAKKGSPYFTGDRTKTTVWDFGGYDKSKNVHPTQKPLFIPSEAINNSSKKGDIVLDLFGGSGSTLVAADQLHREAYLMELDEKYVDVIANRYINYKNSSDDVFLIRDGKKIPYSELI